MELDQAECLLAAERRARALAAALNPQPGDVFQFTAQAGADGLALLSAARLVRRSGARVEASVCDSRHGPPEQDGPAAAAWLTAVESIRLQGLGPRRPDADGASGRRDTFRLVRGGSAITEDDVAIPDDAVAWQAALGPDNPFVHPLRAGDGIVTAAESRAIDGAAMRQYGVPGPCLMEHAAIGAATVLLDMLRATRNCGNGVWGLPHSTFISRDRFSSHAVRGSAISGRKQYMLSVLGPTSDRHRVLVAAGGGNNGGDGLALARGLGSIGICATLAMLKPPDRLTGDAALNWALLQRSPSAVLAIHDLSVDTTLPTLAALLGDATAVVDSLLGTGFSGTPNPAFTRAIEAINASGLPVLALDLPSGLDADTGSAPGACIKANRTVSFAGIKRGLLDRSGRAAAGELYYAEIGAPEQVMHFNATVS